MVKENKNIKTHDSTEVTARVVTDIKLSIVIVSLLTNLMVFVSWLTLLVI